VLRFERARFLPIDNELTVAGRSFVPIDLDLAGTAVLTGPNMGGKSVSLQTCGFLALLVAFGVPVPAAGASIALFDRIAWLGLGSESHTGGLLSSFAQELVALKGLLSDNAERLLVLADEFARTTTPHEGRALVIALLERLRARNACALVATHLQGIAAAAAVRHFAVRGLREIARPAELGDLSAALRELAEAMDYRIVEVEGDDLARADAIALAELLGMDAAFVEAAYRALSQ
jgi:dsDNA-specific endonuclease/ATPase MutS2